MSMKDLLIDQQIEADLTGFAGNRQKKKDKERQKENAESQDEGEAIIPVPAEVTLRVPQHFKMGTPSVVWEYRDRNNQILMCNVRFLFNGQKEDRPLTYRQYKDGSKRWTFKGLEKPRPLYGLNRLAQRPDATVIVCEGEKAADAAQKIFPDFVSITSPNGAKSADHADWSPLHGRDIIIWPDNDLPGKAYAAAVAQNLNGVAKSTRIVDVPGAWPVGWDLADLAPAGVEYAGLKDLLEAAKITNVDPLADLLAQVELDPGAAFEQEVIDALIALRENNRRAYEKLRAELKKRKVRVSELEKLMYAETHEGSSDPSQADILVDLAGGLVLFHTDSKVAYCDAKIGEHRETYPVRGRQLKQYLTKLYHEALNSAPSSESLSAVVNVLEARALFDGPEQAVFLRTAQHEGKYYLDLGNADWSAIEIDATGWRIVAEPPVRFRRTSGMLPLPVPARNGSFETLRKFLNVQEEADFVLVVAWILAALRSVGPYPLMVISGEQGSAKSTFASLLRKIADPNSAGLRTLPREIRDLFIAANNGHVLAFDNLSYLYAWLSDAFCRLSTGGGFATRQLHSDMDEVLFNSMRPIIMNGIDDVITRPDLADRSILLTLEPIPEERRRTEKALMDEFDRELPGILGAFLDMMSNGIKNLPHVHLEKLPRMADFALWVTACEKGHPGWTEGTFINAYNDNFAATVDNVLEASDVASAILSLLDLNTEWSGTATALLKACDGEVTEAVKRSNAWPRTARAMSSHLRRAATFLRKAGIEVTISRANNKSRTRTINISRVAEEPDHASLSSVSAESTGNPQQAQRTVENAALDVDATIVRTRSASIPADTDGTDDDDPELNYESTYVD